MTSVTGTWRLAKAIARDAEGRELPVPYGGQGMGRLALGADGRMAAVLCDARRDIPDNGKREYSSYCGNYKKNFFHTSLLGSDINNSSSWGGCRSCRWG